MDRKKSEKEKRVDLRIGVHKSFPVKFQIKKPRGIFNLQAKQFTRAQNMSVGGMQLELPFLDRQRIERIIEGKDKLVLEFAIPSARKPLKVIGKIIWLAKKDRRGKTVYVAGVSFEGIKEEEQEKILRQLVNSCLKEGCYLE
jgi:hypothetical protein